MITNNLYIIQWWLKKFKIDNYTINDDMSVDVDGDVDILCLNLKEIPIQFNKVTGRFDCRANCLISLKGCPSYVGGDFNCSGNQIVSLEYCPKVVKKSFYCDGNKLVSLKGCQEVINGNFNCSNNELINLRYCPKMVAESFDCSENKLLNLMHCPEYVGGEFNCAGNVLNSLRGCPEIINNNFNCSRNNIRSLRLFYPKFVKGCFDANGNPIRNLDGFKCEFENFSHTTHKYINGNTFEFVNKIPQLDHMYISRKCSNDEYGETLDLSHDQYRNILLYKKLDHKLKNKNLPDRKHKI